MGLKLAKWDARWRFAARESGLLQASRKLGLLLAGRESSTWLVGELLGSSREVLGESIGDPRPETGTCRGGWNEKSNLEQALHTTSTGIMQLLRQIQGPSRWQ